LHDNDDGAITLVVEPTPSVWTNQSLTARRCVSDSASSGFNGSSIKMKSAPPCGQHAANRAGESVSAAGRHKFFDRLPVAGEASRKDPAYSARVRDSSIGFPFLAAQSRHQLLEDLFVRCAK
jgi:hypothetical protein